MTDNPPIQIQINRTENRITFETKTSYYHEFLTPETRKLLGSKERKITKDKDGENIPKLEITEVIVVHHNLVNNIYQQILPSKFVYLNTFNSDFSYTEVWFADQNSKSLKIKDSIS